MKKLLLSVLILWPFVTACSSKEPRMISVSGQGRVTAAPDIVSFKVTVSEIAETNSQAQAIVSERSSAVLAVLADAGVENKDIFTSSYQFHEAAEYSPAVQRQVPIGRRASLTLRVQINYEQQQDSLVDLLDAIGRIEKVELGNLVLDIEDKQPYYIEARRLAYEKARSKAGELAAHSGQSLGAALNISEGGGSAFQPTPAAAGNYLRTQQFMREAPQEADSGDAALSGLPSGEMTVGYSVFVTFEAY